LSVKRSVLTIAILLSPVIYAQEPAAEPQEAPVAESPEEPAAESSEELAAPETGTPEAVRSSQQDRPPEAPEESAAEPLEEPAAESSEELAAPETEPETTPEAVRSSQQDRPPEAPEEPAPDERPTETVEVEVQSSERIVSPWATVLPFGIPQFIQGESKRGWIYASVQAVGVAGSIYTGLEMRRLAEAGDVDEELTYRLISAATVAVTALTWFGSVVDGSNMRIESIERASAAREWESAQRSAIVLVLE
jgi:hypothetical protein